MILDEAEALLDPVSDIEGFMLACLVDASTGMVLASRKDQDDISLPTAAAGAADITNVLFQLTGELPVDGLEGDGDVPPPALRDTPGQSGAADLAAGDSRGRPGGPGYGAPGNPRAIRTSARRLSACQPCSGHC